MGFVMKPVHKYTWDMVVNLTRSDLVTGFVTQQIWFCVLDRIWDPVIFVWNFQSNIVQDEILNEIGR